MKTIMLATDGSPAADEALEFATKLAQDAGAALHVVSVRPLGFHDPVGSADVAPDVRHIHGAETIAAQAAAEARAAGVDAYAHWFAGPEADTLCLEARQLGADLLVIGSRGHGEVAGRLLGSISRKVVAHSPVPVTVVKAAHAAVPASTVLAGHPVG